MNLVSCLYPKVIKNPYTGQRTVCACGKCNSCRNNRAFRWVHRLDMEAECHRYVLFCTLTYDDLHVPQIIRLEKSDFNFYEKNNFAYVDGETGQLYDIHDIKEPFEKKDFDYVRESKVLDVLQKKDFQDFIKRLRYYFDQTDKGARLRYYLCGEYGPRTYRPHGHMLLFYDSERCHNEIQLLLSKSWQNGNVYDPHLVEGSASQYCASYINSVAVLPKVYLHSQIRPFTLFSKSPAIGSLHPNVAGIREIFDRGAVTFKIKSPTSPVFKDEPFWRSFNARLYPRIQRFDSLVHSERVLLYRLVQEFPSWLSAWEIAQRLKAEYIDKRLDTFTGRYLYEISHKRVRGVHFVKDAVNPYAGLPFAPTLAVSAPFYAHRQEIRVFNMNSLVTFVRTALRLIHQAQVFQISINEYVEKIEQWQKNVYLHRLRKDYEFQNEYFKSHPAWHYVYFDLDFYNKVTTLDERLWSRETTYTVYRVLFKDEKYIRFRLKTDGTCVLKIPPIEELPAYQSFKLLHDKIAHDAIKTKENNSYALSHKDKFGNIIHYQNI